MNLYKYLKHILFLALSFTTLSCGDFLDVNDNPNNPLEVSPAASLPAGLAGSAFANANELNRFSSVIMNYLSGAGGSPAAYDIYNTNGADFGNQWRFEIYGGALVTYKRMIEAAETANAEAYSGIGKIMTAYTFSIATDVWGDVPYSQALLGLESTQPRIDKQEDIYKGNPQLGIQSLFDLVREGLAELDSQSTSMPATDDIVYSGNLENWKRAGNTLLLKLALQISKKEPILADTIISQVLARNLYITNNNQNLAVKFGASVGSQSPIHTYTNVSLFRDDLIASTRYINLLKTLNDPRLRQFITFPVDKIGDADTVRSIENGFAGTRPQPPANWSRWNTAITGSNGIGPVRLITNAQRAFILAEAALTLGITLPNGQTTESLFQEGIRASMIEAGILADDITSYFTNNAAVVTLSGTQEEQLEKIITQKYIALTGNGLEAWNDWRRTGYPKLNPNLNAVGIDGTRPVRAQYIDQEVSRNPAFTPVKLPNERVWWDVD